MANTRLLSERSFTRHRRVSNLNVALIENGTLTYEQHALPLSAFNRAGLPDVCFMMKVSEHSRLFPVFQNTKLYTGVIRGCKWYFTPSFYKKAKMVFPMTCERTVVHLGRTSFTKRYTFFDSLTDETLMQGMVLTVLINKSTMRPAPLPRDFVQKYGKPSNAEKTFATLVQTMVEHSGDAHEYHLRVRASDEDFLYHTNQVSYVRFALDAAADASMAGKLHNFPGDIAEYEVAKVEVAHKAPSFAGDDLVVCTWEDEKDKLVLHSQMNRGETVIALCKLQFRFPVMNSNL